MRSRSLLALGGFLAASFGAAAFGSYFTNQSVDSWYRTLEKPDWRPPNAAFGPVWTVLYTLMAMAAWLVWRADDSTASTRTARKQALGAWGVQLALNAAWSAVFFGAMSPGGGLAVIAALVPAIATTATLAGRVSKDSGAAPDALPGLDDVCRRAQRTDLAAQRLMLCLLDVRRTSLGWGPRAGRLGPRAHSSPRIVATQNHGGSAMHAIHRMPVNGRVQETRVASAFDNATSPPPPLRLFPRAARPTEPAAPSLPRVGEPATEGAGAELWYAVFLSAFLIGLLMLGGLWIWLNIRFL